MKLEQLGNIFLKEKENLIRWEMRVKVREKSHCGVKLAIWPMNPSVEWFPREIFDPGNLNNWATSS